MARVWLFVRLLLEELIMMLCTVCLCVRCLPLRLGVRVRHYNSVSTALLDAMQSTLGKRWTPASQVQTDSPVHVFGTTTCTNHPS